MLVTFLALECNGNRLAVIGFINHFISNSKRFQHSCYGILTTAGQGEVIIRKVCTANNTRNVIGRDAHRLFAVKFRIFECGYTLEMIGHLFGYGV